MAPAHAVLRDSRAFYEQAIRSRSRGARVLEYGCGPSAFVSALVDDAGELVGIDISDVAVMQATERAAREGRTARYQVMDAESLDFPDGSFDLVCSAAVLHHLDLRKAFREISRTLRPDGHAIFMEPLGHNPLINWYRRATPDLRTPDEHPLLMCDLAKTSANASYDSYSLLSQLSSRCAKQHVEIVESVINVSLLVETDQLIPNLVGDSQELD